MSHHLKFITTHPPFRVGDYAKVELIRKELRKVAEHQNKLYIEDTELGLENTIYEVLDILDAYFDYEPSDEELLGEAPMTMGEMHANAWKQHVELHS